MKTALILVVIIVLGFFLRFYNLASNPPSLDWDEASLGWNAYSLLTTGTDEYGNAHPVSIRSFNDYKPPLYVYTLVPVQAVFGLTDWSTRFPSAFFGTLTIVVMFFLGTALAKKRVGLVAALLFAVTPWAIQFSRAAFEANLALFWFSLGVLMMVLFITKKSSLYILFSIFCLSLSIYAYHSTRVAVPTFLFLIAIFNFKLFWRNKLVTIVAALIFAASLLPLARNYLRVGGTQARFEAVSIFKNQPQDGTPPLLFYPQEIALNWANHLDPKFLFLTADANDRHHAPDSGLLLFMEALALICAFVGLVKKRQPWLGIIIALILSAPLASALSTGAPHSVRGLLLVLPLTFLSAFGIASFSKKWWQSLAWSLLLFASMFYFTHQYFIHGPIEFAKSWQYGYKALVKEVLQREKNFDAVIVTTAYDQPYIYFLYYGRIAPQIKNDSYFYKTMDKYNFQNLEGGFLSEDLCCKLLIASAPQDQISGAQKIDTIYFPNGQIAFNLWSKEIKK